ncbi:MAG: peptidase, partial [Rhodobacteraceae bacterium]|nr:peptidase [Paracoccaceae bacterium]
GEHKYGKPILDRTMRYDSTLEEGEKAVLLSMDSTLRSNLSVGMPLDLTVLRAGECRIDRQRRIEPGDADFRRISDAWSKALRQSFAKVRI